VEGLPVWELFKAGFAVGFINGFLQLAFLTLFEELDYRYKLCERCYDSSFKLKAILHTRRYVREHEDEPVVAAFKILKKYADGKRICIEPYPSPLARRPLLHVCLYDPDGNWISELFLHHRGSRGLNEVRSFIRDLEGLAERYGGVYREAFEELKVKLLPYLA